MLTDLLLSLLGKKRLFSGPNTRPKKRVSYLGSTDTPRQPAENSTLLKSQKELSILKIYSLSQ